MGVIQLLLPWLLTSELTEIINQVVLRIYTDFNSRLNFNMTILMFFLQEDLTPKDIEEIIDELKAGKIPKPGPRYAFISI